MRISGERQGVFHRKIVVGKIPTLEAVTLVLAAAPTKCFLNQESPELLVPSRNGRNPMKFVIALTVYLGESRQ